MLKCTGICSRCGRCKISKDDINAADRKARMLIYPADFKGDGVQGLGAAFDIGTTTVVGMLWDLKDGVQIAAVAKANPQMEFGADVISRIAYCGNDNIRLRILREKIVSCIDEMLQQLCEKADRRTEDINRINICGNTAMSHLFAGYQVKSLATAPFVPAYEGSLELEAREALAHDIELFAESKTEGSLKLNQKARLTLLPNIAGHVGGDITAGMIAAEVLGDGLTVFIDIGTNGEIVLADGNNVLACSTAAGPALEGASIRHGMRAANGAIERVRIVNGQVKIETVGGVPAAGICGSGLIDAIAQMLEAGLIDETGRIMDDKNPEVIRGERAEKRIVLTDMPEEIAVTQKDIRQVQMAKAAIAAGIQILLKEADRDVDDIDRVVIAGAFGNHIDIDSAVRIGLIPKVSRKKIVMAGNTAGAGVSMTLLSQAAMNLAKKLPGMVKHVELASDKDFQSTYLREMYFYV